MELQPQSKEAVRSSTRESASALRCVPRASQAVSCFGWERMPSGKPEGLTRASGAVVSCRKWGVHEAAEKRS